MDVIESSVVETMTTFPDVDMTYVHKPRSPPQVLIGLDVETSDWDEQISFAKQRHHFRLGCPCHADHTAGNGYVCGLGYCVFSRSLADSNIYVAQEPVSILIKLPESEIISEKAFAYHGISDAACADGQDLSLALKPVIALLRQGAQICCHNLAHETLVFCRELQKRTLIGSPTLSEDDAFLLLQSLYLGHCTSMLANKRNGYYCRLTDEYQRCFGAMATVDIVHDPGQDAYKCACLFLHYTEAVVAASSDRTVRSLTPTVLSTTDGEVDTHQTKKAKLMA